MKEDTIFSDIWEKIVKIIRETRSKTGCKKWLLTTRFQDYHKELGTLGEFCDILCCKRLSGMLKYVENSLTETFFRNNRDFQIGPISNWRNKNNFTHKSASIDISIFGDNDKQYYQAFFLHGQAYTDYETDDHLYEWVRKNIETNFTI
jgi:hypothetical protein